LAETIDEDMRRLCDILRNLKKEMVRRAFVAYERSPETFGEEIVAMNDVDKAIRNNCH
jgi:hypothetical protein